MVTCGHCGGRDKTVAHVRVCFNSRTKLVPDVVENIKPVKSGLKPHALVKVVLTQWTGTAKESKSVTYRCRCGVSLSPIRDKARRLLKDHKNDLFISEYESRENLGRIGCEPFNAADHSGDEVFR